MRDKRYYCIAGISYGANFRMLHPATIKEANDAVKSVTSEGKSKQRGSYAKFTPAIQILLYSFNRKIPYTGFYLAQRFRGREHMGEV